MEQTVHFQSAITYDLATDKEFIRGSREANTGLLLRRILSIVLLLVYQYFFITLDLLWYSLILAGILLVSHVVLYFRLRNGTPTYQQRLIDNNGLPMRNVLSFLGDHIFAVNPDSENVYTYRYDQFRQILETDNLLILTSKLNLSVLINKQTLTGGTTDELIVFLRSHCPNLKKRISKGTLGRTVNIVYAIVLALCILLTVWNLAGIGMISPDADFREIAAALEEMGISGADDALIEDLEDAYADYDDAYISYKVTDYLSWVGMGEYDSKTWAWTPCENGVYWFDAEFWDVSTMYTDFLRGVSALSIDELNFENIKMIVDESDLAEGTGDCAVRLTWNDETYTIDAELYYDWLDLSVADKLSQIIREQNTGKQLYFAFDSSQGFLVFYRDPIWALHFQHKTGIQLYTSLSDNFY